MEVVYNLFHANVAVIPQIITLIGDQYRNRDEYPINEVIKIVAYFFNHAAKIHHQQDNNNNEYHNKIKQENGANPVVQDNKFIRMLVDTELLSEVLNKFVDLKAPKKAKKEAVAELKRVLKLCKGCFAGLEIEPQVNALV